MRMPRLAVLETHPVQYHAPVYRSLQQRFGVAVTAVYGSDFSLVGYRDREFGTDFAWDTDLTSGYTARFLARVAEGGPRAAEETTARGLDRLLHEVNPDAVLLTGYGPGFYRQSLRRALRLGRPVLFRAETTDHARPRSWLKTRLRDGLLRWFYRRCDALLYVGEQSVRHFRRLGCPEEKLCFSPYCVDTAAFACDEKARTSLRPEARAELSLDDGHVVILFSGKLVPRKGPDLLLQAVRELPEKLYRRAVIAFLGDGELRESLRQEAAGEVRFVGFQNQGRLSRYYHAADLLVLPSRVGETWGLVINEALHHGLPCIVSDGVGCAPDLVRPGVTGEVFSAGSAAALADALERAGALVGRPEVRQACRERVAGYTVEAAAAGIARALRAVLEKQAGFSPATWSQQTRTAS